jgi:hypothetical protein
LAGEGLDQRSGPWLRVHFDSLVKARQPIQQYRTSAEIGRHFETVDATADCGSEQSGGTGQPGANIEHAIFGQNLRQRQQLAGSADSAGVEMVKRPQFLRQQPLLGIQSGRADSRQDSRLDITSRIVCFQTSHKPTS